MQPTQTKYDRRYDMRMNKSTTLQPNTSLEKGKEKEKN
jgi:hypothetical protein